MPSLSIVIPYRQDDGRLEATILSVLENRPANCEVIVVHDGTYRDPYALGDEVVFVVVDRGCAVVGLVNAGLLAACSPVVNTLLDGTLVQSGWSDNACEDLAKNEDVAAVACAVSRSGVVTFGLDSVSIFESNALRLGRVLTYHESNDCAAPEIACGFFRRKVLMALGGFNENLSIVGAEIDFAWALDELELGCSVDSHGTVVTAVANDRNAAVEGLRLLASIAVEFEVIESSFRSAAREFLGGCLAGHPIAAYAWSTGLLSAPRCSPAVRVALAKEYLIKSEKNHRRRDDQLHRHPRRAA